MATFGAKVHGNIHDKVPHVWGVPIFVRLLFLFLLEPPFHDLHHLPFQFRFVIAPELQPEPHQESRPGDFQGLRQGLEVIWVDFEGRRDEFQHLLLHSDHHR